MRIVCCALAAIFSWQVQAEVPKQNFEVLQTADANHKAARLFQHLTGVPLNITDPRMAEMAAAITEGRMTDAARIATEDENFYAVTIRTIAASMSSRDNSPLTPLNDFQATFIGAVRDDVDARELLVGDFTYRGYDDLGLPQISPQSNDHYAQFESRGYGLRRNLVKVSPQNYHLPERAGLLTTRAWADAHLKAGTNRRAFEFALKEFLCVESSQWRDASINDRFVRRDVSRSPENDPAIYQNECRACHGIMDGMGGAFARYDFVGGQISFAGRYSIATKMNANSHVYPEGYLTIDDQWINLATTGSNAALGWRGPTRGSGLRAFAAMLAESQAFSRCMTERAFAAVCRRDTERSNIESLAADFEASGRKLRGLFESVAVHESCGLGLEQ
jgi:hypothetical protein